MIKIMSQLDEILLNNVPNFFHKKTVETIWSWGSVSRHVLYSCHDLLIGEGVVKMIKIVSMDQVIQIERHGWLV
jgi:hypothetical protein